MVYSYTLLKTADTCLYKCFRQYMKRDLPFDKTPEIECGNKVHEAMEHRIGGKPLPQEMIHWEPIVSAYVDRKAKPEKKTGITKGREANRLLRQGRVAPVQDRRHDAQRQRGVYLGLQDRESASTKTRSSWRSRR